MDKFDRIFHLHKILASRRTAVPLDDLMARLECSKSTLHRAINALKDNLNAPVVFDADAGGYRYARESLGDAYELPGLWFTPNELQALAVMQRLLKDAGGGLLEEHLGPLARRLNDLTKHQRLNLGEAAVRLRFPSIGARPAGKAFDTVASATLQRKKIWIEYHARTDDKRSERTISPQRIVHYRETWYLDAWDEARNALRSFSVDRILRASFEPQCWMSLRSMCRKRSSTSTLRLPTASLVARPIRSRLSDLAQSAHAGWPMRNGTRSRRRSGCRTAAMN
jgi:proteasome accessory factor C